MPERHIPKRVENYTLPFLVTSGVFLFMLFWTITAVAGHAAMLFTAAAIDVLIQLVGAAVRRG